ncbi:MAG: rRNA pseudouridine synthase [Cyclobacteriaceae bacterium]|nr:rRNA pseudouridine synthase [Cyclobacteriaceae bacterium]
MKDKNFGKKFGPKGPQREKSSGSFDPKKKQIKGKSKPVGPRTRKVQPAPSPAENQSEPENIRLNRYIANAGICSRRDADVLIKNGEITVNGKAILEMGYKVLPGDVIKYQGKVLHREKFVYVLLNKPKDFITTTEDEMGRKTVMDLVKKACKERIFPVGRLDRNTTGILLLTNDGELSKKLTHPSHKVPKVYEVQLDKPLEPEHFDNIKNGIELEDGLAAVDDAVILSPDRRYIGLEIHLGRNRIVRRIFESLGYDVIKLDRVSFAGLNKKDLPRGNWRHLENKEVILLKHLFQARKD